VGLATTSFELELLHLFDMNTSCETLIRKPFDEFVSSQSQSPGDFFYNFSARQHITYMLNALYAIARPSVCPFVCHTKTVIS